MRRRKSSVVTLGLACMLLIGQVAWAAPTHQDASSTRPETQWTTMFTTISGVVQAVWRSIENVVLPTEAGEAPGAGALVSPQGASESGGTCVDPFKLEQGCGVDPDG